MAKLTPRQARFVREYLIDLNATQAAIRAGYTPKMADRKSYLFLEDPAIKAKIDKGKARLAERAGLSAKRAMRELAAIAYSGVADVADWGVKEIAIGFDGDGKRLPPEEIGDAVLIQHLEAPFLRLKDREDLTDEAKAAVSEVALTKDGFKIKMHDKVAALGLIGRHFSLFTDKVRHEGAVNVVIDGKLADL